MSDAVSTGLEATGLEAVILPLVARLSPKRRRHSLAVARCARALVLRFGGDPRRAYAAGLAHDVARELPEEEMIHLVEQAGLAVGAAARRHPVLLHGEAGAILLQRHGVEDSVVLEAVARHVGGGVGLHAVSKAVYAADLLEPGRRFARPLRRTALQVQSLDAVALLVARALVDYYRARGDEPLPETLAMIDELDRGAA